MPYLDLNTRLPLISVRSAMLFPANTEHAASQRQAYYHYYLETCAKGMVDAGLPDMGDDLIEASKRNTALPKDRDRRYELGMTTGELYKVYFGLMINEPQLASWNHAIRVTQPGLKRCGLDSSSSFLWSLLSEFKPVAHLWTAFCLRDKQATNEYGGSFTHSDDIDCFLHEAEILRYHGRHWRREYDKAEPPLNVDCWRVPPDWQVPNWKDDWPRGVGQIPYYSFATDITGSLRPIGRPAASP